MYQFHHHVWIDQQDPGRRKKEPEVHRDYFVVFITCVNGFIVIRSFLVCVSQSVSSAIGAEPVGIGGYWIVDFAYCWVKNFFWRSLSSASLWDNDIANWSASSSSSSAWLFPGGLVVAVADVWWGGEEGGRILPVLYNEKTVDEYIQMNKLTFEFDQNK